MAAKVKGKGMLRFETMRCEKDKAVSRNGKPSKNEQGMGFQFLLTALARGLN